MPRCQGGIHVQDGRLTPGRRDDARHSCVRGLLVQYAASHISTVVVHKGRCMARQQMHRWTAKDDVPTVRCGSGRRKFVRRTYMLKYTEGTIAGQEAE